MCERPAPRSPARRSDRRRQRAVRAPTPTAVRQTASGRCVAGAAARHPRDAAARRDARVHWRVVRVGLGVPRARPRDDGPARSPPWARREDTNHRREALPDSRSESPVGQRRSWCVVRRRPPAGRAPPRAPHRLRRPPPRRCLRPEPPPWSDRCSGAPAARPRPPRPCSRWRGHAAACASARPCGHRRPTPPGRPGPRRPARRVSGRARESAGRSRSSGRPGSRAP